MPISIICEACGMKLSAPDAAAGKRVKCKNCQTILNVPVPVPPEPEPELAIDEDPPEDETPVRAPLKKRNPVVVEDEDEERADEDDEEEEERPKKKSKKKKSKKPKAKTNPLIFVLIGVGALFLLVGGGIGVWYVAIKGSDDTVAKGSSNSPSRSLPNNPNAGGNLAGDWELLDEVNFRALFRKGVPPMRQTVPGPGGISTTVWLSEPDNKKSILMISATNMSQEAWDEFRRDPKVVFDRSIAVALQGFGAQAATSRREIDYQGFKAVELLIPAPRGEKGSLAMRLIVREKHVFQLVIGTERGVSLDDPMVKSFFDGFSPKE